MTPRNFVAAMVVCALAGLPLLPAATPMEARIARVENGLQKPNRLKGSPLERMSLSARMKHYKVPGVSVAVIHAGRVEWARGYGQRDAGSGAPVTAETLFQAASLSKGVAASVAMRLVEQGILSLDEDVNAKLRSWKVPDNEFTRTEKVTLRRLLSHNAGLTVHGFPGYAQGVAVPTLPQLLDGKAPANTAPVRVTKAPGSGYRYSGGGYEVMQLLLEDVTGQRFEHLARALILDPLGMKRSSYEQPLGEERARNAASAYRGDGRAIAGRWHTYPEKTAAGLWTTPSELARWVMEIQKPGRVLKAETVKTMLSKSAGNYGLGIGLNETDGRASFSHGGANEGYRCQYFAYRDSGDGAIVMTNGDEGGDLAMEVLRSIAVEYGWVDYLPKERSVVRVDAAVLASYVGDYAFPGGPVVRIRVKDGQLTSGIGDGDAILEAEAPDSFFDMDGHVPPTRFKKAADGTMELHAGGGVAKRTKP
ncbi:serine hydrolase [uncultured Paludibaculum sp.]|uniref:serine hydrolase n=1 Tax=uncultured Paludibaculum sp. TaxID=1765020 RepID=UPI002AAB0843|nr:serine hydrolase [uncultured Paludibaculum sp.]